MRQLTSRILAAAARRYLGRKGGFDLAKVGMLPDRTLVPLRRAGIDPVPELAAIRDQAPVSRLPVPFGLKVWLVTGYDAAKQVLADGDGFSTDFANLAPGVAGPGGLGFADPPEHTRLRKLLTPEFTMRRLARLTPRIHEIVEDRLDAMAAAPGPVDLVAEFALPIPSLVICELLGVPYADRADFQRLAMARFDVFAGAGASLGAISESLDYLRTVVEVQRRAPGDGLIGMIIREHGDEVTDDELAGLADGVLTGGFETTASMLALGALVLLSDPAAFQLVRTTDEAAAPFVEEVLRHLAVVQVAFPRFARDDLTIAGTQISRGDVVIVSLSGANRDPVLGPNLEHPDPTRTPTSHLAFGHGLHRCIGAELAKMELRAAYPALVRRFPGMRLAVEPAELRFRPASIVYGVESLPVRLG
ncbi:cytochrome P450 [Hamadaea flava]|uniref:Cytochrome P450 n=1 Tax=Hamadaea flava TaxID=1742688 RepID=A0ABV8LVN3_9ACTN|nr:cytochrome P450 [Hamadaea flava]MCP2329164.1 cytochrome P450 [Hamadaea flava]